MRVQHPNYPDLFIISDERAEPGAFYVPKRGTTLSHIATAAYGAGTISYVSRINKSPWNMDNCVYRKSSSNCYSSKVQSSLALQQNHFGDGAWLSVCQVDVQPWAGNMGYKFPVIWVPGVSGEEPDDLQGGTTPEPEPEPTPEPGPEPTPEPGPEPTPEPGPGPEPKPEPKPEKKTSPWVWVGVAAGVVALGGILFAVSRKKKSGTQVPALHGVRKKGR